jgi:hypothetical protein
VLLTLFVDPIAGDRIANIFVEDFVGGCFDSRCSKCVNFAPNGPSNLPYRRWVSSMCCTIWPHEMFLFHVVWARADNRLALKLLPVSRDRVEQIIRVRCVVAFVVVIDPNNMCHGGTSSSDSSYSGKFHFSFESTMNSRCGKARPHLANLRDDPSIFSSAIQKGKTPQTIQSNVRLVRCDLTSFAFFYSTDTSPSSEDRGQTTRYLDRCRLQDVCKRSTIVG